MKEKSELDDSKVTSKPMTLKTKLGPDIREWLLSTTAHGVPKIVSSKNVYIKLIWLLCLLCSAAICSFLVARGILTYLDYQVVTNINVIYDTQIVFPTVTVCNLNPFVTDEGFAFVKNISDAYGIKDFGDFELGFSYKETKNKFRRDLQLFNYITMVNTKLGDLTETELRSFGLNFSQFFASCFFNGFECTESDFVWTYNPQHGNCFKFNSGYDSQGNKVELKRTTRTGAINGFQITLFVGFDNNNYSISHGVGAHIYLSNDTITPAPLQGINTDSGSVTSLILEKSFTSQLPVPYNDCRDDLNVPGAYNSVLVKAILEANETYLQSACFRLCVQKAIVEACGCYDINYPQLYNARPCVNSTDSLCAYPIYLSYLNSDTLPYCTSLCPLECDRMDYMYTTNMYDFPSDSYAELMANKDFVKEKFAPGQTITTDLLRKNFAAINVYYDETKYMVVSQEAKLDLVDLISSLGGTLGLFLGISFLSFIELVELFLQTFLICCTHYFTIRTRPVKEQFDCHDRQRVWH